MMAFALLLEHRPDEDEFEPVSLRATHRLLSQHTGWSGKKRLSHSSSKKRKTGTIRKTQGKGLAAEEKRISQKLIWSMPEHTKQKTKQNPQAWNDFNPTESEGSEDDPRSRNPRGHDLSDDNVRDPDHSTHTPDRSRSENIKESIKRALECDSEESQDIATVPIRKLKFTRPVVSDEEGDDYAPQKDLASQNLSYQEDQEWVILSSDEAEEEDDGGNLEEEGGETGIEDINQEALENFCRKSSSPGQSCSVSEYWKNLLDHLKKLCCLKQGQDLNKLLGQWYLTRVEDLDLAEGHCPCGKVGIRYLYHIKNVVTKKETYVGSKCILLFKPFDQTVAKIVRELLTNGITGILIDKTKLRFELGGRSGFVEARDKFRRSGALPLQMTRKANASCPVLTMTAAERVSNKIHKLKKGMGYRIWLQLSLKKETNCRGRWTVEMIRFAPVSTRELVPRDVKQFIRE